MAINKMRVTGSEGSEKATYSEIAIEIDAPESVKSKIKQEVGEFLVEQTLSALASADTPVVGEKWPALSKKYRIKKEADGLSGVPDMEFSGDMKDALTFKKTDDGIELGFFGSKAWQADGHLKFSGEKGTAPRRRFLPGEGQKFDADIQDGVEKIIADNLVGSEAISKADLEDVNSKAELYDSLSEMFPDLSRTEIKAAILRDPRLTNLLDDMDLLEML